MKHKPPSAKIAATAIAVALVFSGGPTLSAQAVSPDPNRAVPCPMGNVEQSSHSSESTDPQTTSTKSVPVSVSISSVKLIGYVRQGSRVTGDPGMTISISRSVGTTFSAGISASATAEAGVLFAKASVTAGVTVTTSWTTNRTEQGSWTIPNNGRRGWISIGSDKYRVTGRIRYATPSCTFYTKAVTYDGISKGASFKRGQF